MTEREASPDREALLEEFNRAVTDQIAIADRALSVADAIAETAPEDHHFGGLMYHLQTTQADAIVLALSRLFDPPPSRYPTRSIAGFLSLLERHADDLVVYSRTEIEGFLASHSPSISAGTLSNGALTRAFVSVYQSHLTEDGLTSATDPAAVLNRVRRRRDKQVAHNENWRPAVDDIVSWQDLRELLGEAKTFAGLIGPAYLRFHFLANDGTYMVTKSSRMVGVQTERLLKAASEWFERAIKT